jgi:pimeloyl-ACP methyl ester carboxylesterase
VIRRRRRRHAAGRLNHLRRGSGPPLLLLHSLGGSIVQWDPVLDRLAAEREVIAVDMPGFGTSPPLPEGIEPTAANLAGAVLDFYESLALEQPGVAGISLGAWVAIECGRRGGVKSVVALSPAGFWKEPGPPGRSSAYWAARAMRPLAQLMRAPALRRAALARNVHRPARVPAADAIALVRGYGGASAYLEANRHMCEGVVGDLSDLRVPLTIAWAEHDQIVRSRPLKDGILPKRVRQMTLPGCGHVPTWDAPGLVAEVILEATAAE